MKGFLWQQEERKSLANNMLSYDRGKGYLTRTEKICEPISTTKEDTCHVE